MQADLVVKSIIFNKNCDRILLLQRSEEDPVGANTWEGVGGNIESGETPEEAIKREVREETGITKIAIRNIAYATLVYSDEPYLIMAYICQAPTDTVTLSNEHQAFLWADQEACRKLLPEPIIDDFSKNGIFDLFHNPTD